MCCVKLEQEGYGGKGSWLRACRAPVAPRSALWRTCPAGAPACVKQVPVIRDLSTTRSNSFNERATPLTVSIREALQSCSGQTIPLSSDSDQAPTLDATVDGLARMATGHTESPYDNPYDDDHAVLEDDFLNDGTQAAIEMHILKIDFWQRLSPTSHHTAPRTAPR
jgi:hypothetical protein